MREIVDLGQVEKNVIVRPEDKDGGKKQGVVHGRTDHKIIVLRQWLLEARE